MGRTGSSPDPTPQSEIHGGLQPQRKALLTAAPGSKHLVCLGASCPVHLGKHSEGASHSLGLRTWRDQLLSELPAPVRREEPTGRTGMLG